MKTMFLGVFCAIVMFQCPYESIAGTGDGEVSQSARAFVTNFYKWYVPLALADNTETAWSIALKDRHADFSNKIYNLLVKDAFSQSRCNEVVGIDFDPFLNSQDPVDDYEVGEMINKNLFYEFNIYGLQSGRQISQIDLIVRVTRVNHRWEFTNFYYPQGSDLLTILEKPKLLCSEPR